MKKQQTEKTAEKKSPAKATHETDTPEDATPVPEAPKAKAPRLSEKLRARADQIIAERDGKGVPKAERKRGEPKEELVVFAFRLTPEERDAIHKAAGAAKASRFVRSLAVAAARKDASLVQRLVEAIS